LTKDVQISAFISAATKDLLENESIEATEA
jgi:hypothetical protein